MDRISVGKFTYYDDPDDPTAFERKSVYYAYGSEWLIIGRYCALAAGVLFIMSGANHKMDGPSTFPFAIFGGEWMERTLDLMQGTCPAAATRSSATTCGSVTRQR